MSILKSAFVALALILGSVGFVTVSATPAVAALSPEQQLVQDLANQRRDQLIVQMAPFQAIIDSPTASNEDKINAQAAIQRAQFRAFQMQLIANNAALFSTGILGAIAVALQFEVSANTSLVTV